MTTLRDLVLEVQEAAVVEAIARFYDQRESRWLPDAVADVLGQLRKLAPDPAGSRYQLSIELTSSVDAKDQPFWDVTSVKEDDPERCGLDLSPWEEWIAVHVPQSLLDKMTAAEIVAHCVWEMTFYGFTQEKIAAFRAELECSVKENRLIEIEIHPTPLSCAETARLWLMQTTEARLGRQEDIQRFATCRRSRAGNSGLGARRRP